MTIPKYIEIKTAAGVRAAFLSPKADGLKGCYPDSRLNGESIFEFMLPADSPKISALTPECQIWAAGKVYSLLKPDAVDTVRDENNKLWAKFMAVERWKTDLETSFIEPYLSNDPSTPTPADLAVIIVAGGSSLSGGIYTTGTAAHAMYAILQGSGWSLGTCDVTGTHDIETEKKSRLELIKMVQNIWGGYLVWDSVNKTVSLRNAAIWQPYNGFQIRHAKNLKHITRTQSNRIITKLYCFGHDDLDIASVNGGVKYLTNFSYTTREYIGIYKNQDIYDAQELKDKATAELALVCKPRYHYTVKVVDLRTLPEYSHEDFTLGDMVDIIDSDVAPESPRPRLIRHKYNLFKPWECELEVGDPEERLIERLKAAFDAADFIGGVYNGNGRSSGHYMEDGSIGAGKLKVAELVVGDNITMGPNARISWSQVTDQPTIPVLPSYIKSTYIDSTQIQSPTIIGGSITGGTVTAGTTYKMRLDSNSDYGALNFLSPSNTWLGALHCNSDSAIALESQIGIRLSAYGGMQLESLGGIIFSGPVNFSGASVSGLNFAPAIHSHPEYSPTGHTHNALLNGSGQTVEFQVYDGHLEFRVNGGSFTKVANFHDI